jgi:hypothetical protein
MKVEKCNSLNDNDDIIERGVINIDKSQPINTIVIRLYKNWALIVTWVFIIYYYYVYIFVSK